MSRQDTLIDLPRLPWLAAAITRASSLPGFRRQIIRHAITAMTLALMLLLLDSGLHDFSARRAQLDREAALLTDLVAATIAAQHLPEEEGSVEALLAPVRDAPHIDAAIIRGADGVVLAAIGQPVKESALSRQVFGRTQIVRTVRHAGVVIGEVRLHISHRFLVVTFLQEMLWSLLALVLVGAISALLLYRALFRFSSRLADLTDTMSGISASGNFGLRLPEQKYGEVREVAVLSRSLNALLDEVQGRSFNLECELENSRLIEMHLGKMSLAVENSAVGIFITDPDGWIEYANTSYLEMNGLSQDDCIGIPSLLVQNKHLTSDLHASMWDAMQQGHNWQGEISARRKGGELYWGIMSLASIRKEDGSIAHIISNIDDVSEHKRAEETINRLAYYDALTMLPNRHSFGEQLPRLLARATRKREMVAVCYLDLDRFKEVNDTLGHSMGDHLLQTAAKRLQSVLREHDVVARLGGDEFALIIPNLHDRASAEVVARKIIDHMTAPFRLDGRELSVTASMGMVFFPEHGSDADDLLKKADIALYRAKALGRNNFQIFSLGLEEVGLARRELEAQIRQALVTEDFFLEYQPKLDLGTGKLCGAEALIRWNHPTLGRLPPDKFIPLAEESRLIIPLGHWIINEVARQQAAWSAEGLLVVPVALNLSTMQFKNDDLPMRFSEALRQHHVSADLIELEITESLLMDDPEGIRLQLAELDAMGIGIAIDDFGTGYSSLSYLRTLPVDVLKIDRSFVRDIETTDDRITQAIIAMAKSLDLKVVAEGAETAGQIEHLRKLGCDVIQGYAYSRPLAADVFAIFLRAPSDEEVSVLAE